MAHQLRLVLDAANGHEAHVRPSDRLADRRRIDRVILAAPDIRLHIRRRDQLHLMAELDQRARPMMRRTARFDSHHAWRQRCEKAQQLPAPNRLGDHQSPSGVNAMHLKDILGDVEPDDRDRRQILDRLAHGRLSSDGL
jgi:hypothetical protein